ncbi:MAG TPA: hypothetical protein VJ986_04200 [Gaiellaceae bacterium]|nr:hypothetical protein [Gaiellaceae bacterium]
MRTKDALATLAGLAGAGLVYRRVLRRLMLDWGASAEEARGHLPGDELLAPADVVSTRAITIRAPAPTVWPWLVQMGPGDRGGAYSYDWIENLLGLDMHSVDRILPQFQHVEVGDVIPDRRGVPWLRYERVEPERVLAFRSADGTWVWTFVLVEEGGWTRLLSRNRIRVGGSLGGRLALELMIPGSLAMERKMLHGIGQRAERLAAEEAEEAAAAEAV